MVLSITVSCAAISSCYFLSGKQQKQFLISSFPSNDSFLRTKVCVFKTRACLFNPNQQPILKEAFKEPVAFLGGIFAGILRLDLNEEPLKEWVARTVEASGISEEEISTSDVQEEMPQQIEIE